MQNAVTQLRSRGYCAIAFDIIRKCVHMIRMPLEDNLQTSVAIACRAAEGQASLARALGIRQSTVSSWLRRGNELPAKFVIPVERAYGISRHDLRPDLYPPEERVPAPQPPAQHPAAQPSAPDLNPLPEDGADGHHLSAAADGPVPALDYPRTARGAVA